MDPITIQHSDQQYARGFSYGLWGAFPFAAIAMNPNLGFVWDMGPVIRNPPVFASATPQMGFKTYQDTSCTIQGRAGDERGCLDITLSTTANNEASIQTGSGVSGMAKISRTAGSIARVTFEGIVDVSRITDTLAWCLGLGTVNKAVADVITDTTGALASALDFIGFRVLAGDGDGIDAVYKEASGSEVVVKDVAANAALSTFFRLGFVYEPNLGKVLYYVNGAKCESNGVPVYADVTASDFPLDVVLAPIAGIKTVSAAAATLGIAAMRLGVQYQG